MSVPNMNRRFSLTNLSVYLSIATESLRKAKEIEAAQRLPRPGGEGFIISYDPNRSSFKHSLIAIVLSGIYLDALLYVEGTKRLGRSEYVKIEKKHYEAKLQALGLNDADLIDACKRFRESRNDLVHEKALEQGSLATQPFRTAQKEAEDAVAFIIRISRLLRSRLVKS
jgi:hypothetical protein